MLLKTRKAVSELERLKDENKGLSELVADMTTAHRVEVRRLQRQLDLAEEDYAAMRAMRKELIDQKVALIQENRALKAELARIHEDHPETTAHDEEG